VNSHATQLRLVTLGNARIFVGSTEVDPSAGVVFATALYLILERHAAVSRKTLQQVLWSGAAENVAAHRLRQTLLKLRKVGFPIESTGRSLISLSEAAIAVDFESISDSDLLTDSTFPRGILAGFEPRLSWQYSNWLDDWRHSIGAALTSRLLGRIAKVRLEGDWTAVDLEARRLLRISPLNEEATLSLAESIAMRGDKMAAVGLLDDYLTELGPVSSDIKVPATIMRRRIADRMPLRDHEVLKETPLLGRQSFLELLANHLRDASNSHSNSVAIWGEAGIGKSRLLTEFLSFATLQGASCQRITCRSTDSNRPLAILLELIPLLQDMRGAIGSSPETLEFFKALTTHRPNSHGASRKRQHSDLLSSSLFAAFADIIGAVTEEVPLVISIEDCQWLDSTSAGVLAEITQKMREHRLLLVFTSRSHYNGCLASHPFDAHTISLPALEQRSSEELIQTIIRQRGRQVSTTYLKWCTTVAEGNPFFLHEFANHWLETQEEHPRPPSLTAVLKQRLARISSNSLQLLQTCAVLENHASLDNVEAVLGYPAHELLHCINELSNAGMLSVVKTDTSVSGGARFNSRHDLLSEVALGQLTAPGRLYLHRQAAKVLEGLIQESGDAATLWSCAKHWQLAGDVAQAFRLAKSCANHLLEAGLPNDAADAFARAVRYSSTDADLLTILEGQANAFYRGSDWQNVTATITKAKQLKKRLQPDSMCHDELELMQLRADWQTLKWNEILTRSLHCLNAEDATGTHRVEAGVMALMMLSFSGDVDRASTAFEAIVKLGSTPDVQAGPLLQAKMVYHTHWGSFDEAEQTAFDLVKHDKKSGDIGRIFRSLCNASVTFRAAGRFVQAEANLREALSLAERHHLYLSKARALPMLANLALERGKNDEAKQWLDALATSHIASEDVLGHAEVSAISARIALIEGRGTDAMRLIEQELAHMRDDQVPQRRAYRAALAVAAELLVDGVATNCSLNELSKEHELTRGNIFQTFATYALYVGLLSARRAESAEKLLREYLQLHRREPWAPPEHLLQMMMNWIEAPSDPPKMN
jgi:DNA-binding SARP family transcriptional activator/tetratricopeptide (TPR) repeat protein